MSENKEKVEKGKFVAYAYKVYDSNTGELLFEAPTDAPDTMIYGYSPYVVPGLVAAMDGLGEGDKFEVELPAEAAFGPRFDENVLDLDKDIFKREDGSMPEEVKVGAKLTMMTDRQIPIEGLVLEIGDDKVKMDFNHPLAGKTLRYEGEVLQVRDASQEEIDSVTKSSCGCGCSGGCGDGGCGDGNCGDGGCDGCK